MKKTLLACLLVCSFLLLATSVEASDYWRDTVWVEGLNKKKSIKSHHRGKPKRQKLLFQEPGCPCVTPPCPCNELNMFGEPFK